MEKKREVKPVSQLEKTRVTFFWTFIITLFIVQLLYHDFNIYLRVQNTGSFDIADLPITPHNRKLYTLLRTEINFTDFVDFVHVDISDQVRDGTVEDPADIEQLSKINPSTVFTRVQLRRYIGKYLPERIHITG